MVEEFAANADANFLGNKVVEEFAANADAAFVRNADLAFVINRSLQIQLFCFCWR